MTKRLIPNRERVFSIGCWLQWDAEKKTYHYLSNEDDAFYDGLHVEFDDDGNAYVETE